MKLRKLWAAALLLAACEGSVPGEPVSPRDPHQDEVGIDAYTKVNLGVPAGCTGSRAWDINKSGRIAGDGSGGTCGGLMAIIWKPNRSIVKLPHPTGSTYSSAIAENDLAQTVGFSSPGGQQRAVYWPTNTTVQYLPDLGGSASYASDINLNSVIVGWSDLPDGTTQAVYWEGGFLVPLETLPGGTFALARGINDQGQVVGISNDGGGAFYAVTWDVNRGVNAVPLIQDLDAIAINNGACPLVAGSFGATAATYDACTGELLDLFTLGGPAASAQDVNSRLRVVGWSQLSTGVIHAFTRGRVGSSIVDLGTLSGYTSSVAEGVNFCGQIVGYSSSPVSGSGPDRAMLWNQACR